MLVYKIHYYLKYKKHIFVFKIIKQQIDIIKKILKVQYLVDRLEILFMIL